MKENFNFQAKFPTIRIQWLIIDREFWTFCKHSSHLNSQAIIIFKGHLLFEFFKNRFEKLIILLVNWVSGLLKTLKINALKIYLKDLK